MTAAEVSEHRLGRQSFVLSPWRVPQSRCIERVFLLRRCINQFTIFLSIDSPIFPGYAHIVALGN